MHPPVPVTPVLTRAPLLGPVTTAVLVFRQYQPQLEKALALANGNAVQSAAAWLDLQQAGDYLVLEQLTGSLTQQPATTLPGYADARERHISTGYEVRFGFATDEAALPDWLRFFRRQDLFLWFETPGRFWQGGYVAPRVELPIAATRGAVVPLAVALRWEAPYLPQPAYNPLDLLRA